MMHHSKVYVQLTRENDENTVEKVKLLFVKALWEHNNVEMVEK